MSLKARTCPNCGAPLPRGKYDCEYCGTSFEIPPEDEVVCTLYADNRIVEEFYMLALDSMRSHISR